MRKIRRYLTPPKKLSDLILAFANKLFLFIDETISQGGPSEIDHCKCVARTLRSLAKKYSGKRHNLYLAGVIIDLDRYLDLYQFGWLTTHQRNEFNKLFKIIITTAGSVLLNQPLNLRVVCGGHEDGACECGPMTPCGNFMINSFPPKVVQSFCSQPSLMDLSKLDITLTRVIDKQYSRLGAYWLIGRLPSSRKEWRSKYAVLSKYNKGTYYVEMTVTPTSMILPCWQGFVASVFASIHLCILKGGALQVWIPPTTMSLLSKYISSPMRTGW